MHEEPKSLLKNAILKCLPAFRRHAGKYKTQSLVWEKKSGSWSGTIVDRPDDLTFYHALSPQLEAAAEPFFASLQTHHPSFCGLVGFQGLGQMKLNCQGILAAAMGLIEESFSTFKVSESDIDTVLRRVEEFFDRPKDPFYIRSQLINFSAEVDRIELFDDLWIRRLTEEEVTGLYGGRLDMGPSRGISFGIHEFCVEGSIEIPKVFSPPNDGEAWSKGEEAFLKNVKERLDRVVLCLRLFKEGPVAYDFVHFVPRSFCPLSTGSCGLGDTHIPGGSYKITSGEQASFIEHLKEVQEGLEVIKKTDLACSRLLDSQIRTKPRDKLVDAVIGLESLLISNDNQNELSFRFGLNYAMLFDDPEAKENAFKVARDLYTLRSTVAHGSKDIQDLVRVGEKKIPLSEAANVASNILRRIIRHLLQNSTEVIDRNFWGDLFWKKAYFGNRGIPAIKPD